MNDNPSTQERPSATEMTLADALAYALQLQREGQVKGAAQLYARILEQAPEHVDALHFLGIIKFQLGNGEAAVALIERAIALKPDFAGAHNNLGNILQRLDRITEATQAYRRAIVLDPRNVDAHNNLGVLLRTTGSVAEAETFLRCAVTLDPQHADAFYNLGNVLVELDRLEEATDMYIQAAQLRPHDAKNYFQLGATLYSLKREQDALKVYNKWLEIEPDNDEAQHLVAAASREAVPERASDTYVQRTFDRFAASFDQVLKKLEYRAPQLLVDLTTKTIGTGTGNLAVLDAGCGTGLCGPLLKAWAHRLVGVDLSPKMIEKAGLRAGYDHLEVAELTAYLSMHPVTYDLIISADTLCYFGDLCAVVEAGAASLRPDGRFGFTVEKAEEADAPDDYCLQFHGRYSHTERYVRRVLAGAGLEVETLEAVVLRTERRDPVHGFVVMTKRKTA